MRQKQCRWPIYAPVGEVDAEALRAGTSALAMLNVSDDPQAQLDAALNYTRRKVPTDLPPLAPQRAYGHERIRVAYCSGDFCTHPVAMLTVELFEQHDKERFETYAFCWSPDDGSLLRRRIVSAVDHYVPVNGMSDEQIARLIREHEIDILVDLQGQTSGAKTAMLARRPAPIQITYLGLPATTGLPCIDYVIADRYLIPDGYARFYSETPLCMPDVYQVSDRKRLSSPAPSRAACGLLEDRFVFCSFNNNHKYTLEVFTTWMNILRRVPDSVLWLLSDNPWAEANLRQQARAQGVDPARLVFAPRAVPADYLARYLVADLFLDTFPFNAGTTANDALWMGLPVLTMSGRSFASRMAGALLTAAGLPELITGDLRAYEEKATALAADAGARQVLRDKLGQARREGPLFDATRFTRNLEEQYAALVERSRSAARSLPSVENPSSPRSGDRAGARLLVEGWRDINHSYALVNQYHLYEWMREERLRIVHRDMPLLFDHWKEARRGSGFPDSYQARLARVPAWQGEAVDGSFRICSPAALVPEPSHPVSTFIVTEFGLDDALADRLRRDSRDYFDAGGSIVTPSRWSRDRIVDAGLPAERIHVVPHGVAADLFHPMSADQRAESRRRLGFDRDDVVFLNVSAPLWNKGVDVLVQAFVACFDKHPHVRLLIKDQQAVYGISGRDAVLREIVACGQGGNDALLAAIRFVSADLDLSQLRELYCVADYYVSPYRAEGFNLPVIEAIACGTPVIVTEGGATDDFCDATNALRIASVARRNVQVDGRRIDGFQEPIRDALVAHLETCARSTPFSDARRTANAKKIVESFTWERAARRIADIVLGDDVSDRAPAGGTTSREPANVPPERKSMEGDLSVRSIDDADAYVSRGKQLQDQGSTLDALRCFERAIELAPMHVDAHIQAGFQLLTLGQFDRGAREIAWMWHGRFPALCAQHGLFVDEAGRSIRQDGRTIMLCSDASLGDSIQFVRYAQRLRDLGARVVVRCQRELVRLLQDMEPLSAVHANEEPMAAHDVLVPFHNLIGAFRTTPATVPNAVPYIAAREDEVVRYRERMAGLPGLHVGLCWAGNPNHPRNQHRSIGLSLMARLIKQQGVTFFSLQKGGDTTGLDIVDWSSEFDDMATTAALVENLDLIVTVDSAIAHLAGALGRPVWMLNRFDTCWRWMQDRMDSPWYPTMRIFRQNRPGDWESVIDAVQAELHAMKVTGEVCDESSRVHAEPLAVNSSVIRAPGKDGLICPVCATVSSLLDVVDLSKSCNEQPGKRPALTGIPVYYARCGGCGFCWAPELHRWPMEKFSALIYNDGYDAVDPDYLDVRPTANAMLLRSMFPDLPSSVRHLDYGGGHGALARRLRGANWTSVSYDPFVDDGIADDWRGQFQLITAFEVFEHVPDVGSLLSNLSSLLSADGVVLFSTLVSDGEIDPGRKLDWWYASPRNGHISLFSKMSLLLLAKTAGFSFGSFSNGLHAIWRTVPPWASHLIQADAANNDLCVQSDCDAVSAAP
ncbi:MAG: methyltransferase domain-containing protein [Burkholderiaceae bacterium]